MTYVLVEFGLRNLSALLNLPAFLGEDLGMLGYEKVVSIFFGCFCRKIEILTISDKVARKNNVSETIQPLLNMLSLN